jgi:hypothetical protein
MAEFAAEIAHGKVKATFAMHITLLTMKPGNKSSEKNRRQMTAVRSGLQKRIGHGAGKRQPFNPLLGWLVLIDATDEQETAPTASPLHLTRDVDTWATPMSHARNVRPFL